MSGPRHLSRRLLLSGGTGAAAAIAGARSASSAPRRTSRSAASARTRRRSLNGWPVESRADAQSTVWTRPVSGTALEVPVRLGVAEALLVHVVRRVHYEIEAILPGELSGWEPLGRTSTRSAASNLASGTAVRIRPGARSDAYFPLQLTVLRDVLADAEGAVRWGGDDADRDESLFYLDLGPDDDTLVGVGRRLRRAAETPGRGAGVVPDALDVDRRRAARAVARRQGVA